MPSLRIAEFDTWRPGYGFATVNVYLAGTNTLASIYTDEDLTTVAANPQTLIQKTDGGVSYGKFAAPVYVGVPYELAINSVDVTGVTRPPLTTLDGQDATLATVMATGGSEDVTLADHLARRIDVRDFGEFIAVGEQGASASTNTATLTAALGAAGARAGGFVEVPDGTYAVTTFTVPQGVVLRGAGRAATILQSTSATNVATIGGSRAGFSRITLDGVTLVSGSVGVYAVAKDQIVFDDAEIKRFETGIYRKGGSGADWRELYISQCVTGYKAHGDLASALGAVLEFNTWTGGIVELCTTAGIELKNIDAQCAHNTFSGLGFDSNTGAAVAITGARTERFEDCWWDSNTKNVTAADGSPVTTNNTVIGLEFVGGSMVSGTIELTGTLEAVAFRRMDFTTVAVTLTTPSNNILVEDCREISGNTFAGVPTAWTRHKTYDRGNTSGVTTGNTATKVWEIALDHGQKAYLEGKVVGRGRNTINTAFYHLAVSVGRPGASLAYDTQTANFTAGLVVTGATSAATARIAADSDSGATGTLTLQDVVGVFVDNEIITDTGGGSATVNGTMTTSNAALVGTVAAIRAAQETNANTDATFVANGGAIELRVTGDTAQTWEWVGDVDVVST